MSDLRPRPAFTGMAPVPAPLPGVTVRLIQPAMVSVLARKDQTPALIEKAKTVFGLNLADAPAHSHTGEVAALGMGPGRWMFLHASPQTLVEAFAGLASLSDHSDGYAVFEIGGVDARRALAKGVPLDLEMFGAGDAAVTTIAHIGAIVWKSGPERFTIAVFRSYAASFWHWLHASAAEFGLQVENDQ
jgi:heterotetrameric sarcosine oxidase gamma subunit